MKAISIGETGEEKIIENNIHRIGSILHLMEVTLPPLETTEVLPFSPKTDRFDLKLVGVIAVVTSTGIRYLTIFCMAVGTRRITGLLPEYQDHGDQAGIETIEPDKGSPLGMVNYSKIVSLVSKKTALQSAQILVSVQLLMVALTLAGVEIDHIEVFLKVSEIEFNATQEESHNIQAVTNAWTILIPKQLQEPGQCLPSVPRTMLADEHWFPVPLPMALGFFNVLG
ncbi:hypothetical protein llap_13701 [Limosa lapponica baueri]|uniref:Uncharacterized protein n=1 Tax=Limosa lapponica baueri TaxID=1758121 RepID=A0A2I0TQE4_LIMLA|nr:hypothetical protein llap_13701 [Limosa lapponica baueri]